MWFTRFLWKAEDIMTTAADIDISPEAVERAKAGYDDPGPVLDALRAALTASGEALRHAKAHIEQLHADISDRAYKADELLHPDAWLGVCDGKYNGDWASIREIIDAAMEKANG